MFMASNVPKVAAIFGWNGFVGSMGPGGHVRCLDLVIGAMTGAQWVRNDRLRGPFLAWNPHFRLEGQRTFLASNVIKMAIISGWNRSYGSMRPGGHARCLDLVMGATPGAQ